MSIFSNYDDFKYIYPPRAEAAIEPSMLDDLGFGWIAQPKYNGSCSVVFVNGRNDYGIFNRHGERLTLQRPIQYTALNDSDKYMVLCGEYLNKNKVGEDGIVFNHKFIIWDILVWKGEYLVGRTFEDRLTLLHTIFGTSRGYVTPGGIAMFDHLHATGVEDVFMAPSYQNYFKDLYEDVIQTDLYEGLVLKKAEAKLELGFREKNNTTWQVKARKPTKIYKF